MDSWSTRSLQTTSASGLPRRLEGVADPCRGPGNHHFGIEKCIICASGSPSTTMDDAAAKGFWEGKRRSRH